MKQACSREHSHPNSDKCLRYLDGSGAQRVPIALVDSVSQRHDDGEDPKHHEQGKGNQ